MRIEYTNRVVGGISRRNRVLLDKLNRETKAPFNILKVSGILEIDLTKTRRLVAYWVSRGWLTRIKRGLFATVPLGAINPSSRKEDPWVIVASVFEPCYIGGWSACEYWGLTDQIFKDIVVFTFRRVRNRRIDIQDTTFIVRNIKKEKIFGIKPVWRGQIKINISDPSRTLVDILNEPYLGGGIKNVANILNEYFESENKNIPELFNYILKLGNRTIYKRLGYFLENFKINLPEALATCRKKISSGYSSLDPSLPPKGRFLRRWNLCINADIETGNL